MNSKIFLLTIVLTLLCSTPTLASTGGFISVDHGTALDLPSTYLNTACRNAANSMRLAIGYKQAGNNAFQVGALIDQQYMVPNISKAYGTWIDTYARAAIIQLFGIDVKPYLEAPPFSTIAQMSSADYGQLYKTNGWHPHSQQFLEKWAYNYCMQHPKPSQLVNPNPSPKSVATAADLTCKDIQYVTDQIIENTEPFGGSAVYTTAWVAKNVLSTQGQNLLNTYLNERYYEIKNMNNTDPAASDESNENLPSDVRNKILAKMQRKIHYIELATNNKQCPSMLKQVQVYDQRRLKQLKAEEN